MGMTIDETIEFFNGLECHTPQAKNAKDVVINIMRKYKKIEQITQNTSITDGSNAYAIAFIDIKRVIEDGNNN